MDGTRELQGVAGSAAFRSAVAWQNRTVLDTGIAYRALEPLAAALTKPAPAM